MHCGEGGIRTHGTLARTTVFETARINHSRTSPGLQICQRNRKLILSCPLFAHRFFPQGTTFVARPPESTTLAPLQDYKSVKETGNQF
jgi:hypothetical protein